MLTRETVASGSTHVSFYFDPICPWTWITSRWLVEVAALRDLTVDWRTFSLAELNGGVEEMPEQYQDLGRFSMRALRVIEALHAAGLNGEAGRLYTELGTRLHVEGEPAEMTLLRQAAEAAGVADYLAAAEDSYWDSDVKESTSIAMRLAGPDTGSPVIQLGGQNWGLHGPIVSPAPRGEDAVQLWDALRTLARVPGFYELKHGRTGAPIIQPVKTRVQEAAF